MKLFDLIRKLIVIHDEHGNLDLYTADSSDSHTQQKVTAIGVVYVVEDSILDKQEFIEYLDTTNYDPSGREKCLMIWSE